jgi:hypothetical protein
MKTIFNAALLALLGTATTALAAGGAPSAGLSWLVILFLVFGALIVVFQMIPGLLLFFSMLRGLFLPSAKRTTPVSGMENENKS